MFTFPGRRNTAFTVAAAGASAVLLAIGGQASAASKAECFGQRATITSNAGKISGTRHDDVILAGARAQHIDGGPGRDLICADGGNDVVDGGPGRDRIDGDQGDDRLSGGADADLVTGNRGDDVIDGDVNGGDNLDILAGGSGDDLIRGGGGRDALFDGPGADVLRGDDGDDLISPQDDRTADRYSGGGDIDTIDYHVDEDSAFDDGVTVSLDGVANDGVNCPQQCEGDNAEADIENIGGSLGDDTLVGNDGANVIEDPESYYSSGTNTIQGLGGDDIVRGGNGSDSIDGGAGDDSLHGNEGDDSLDGGANDDECFGDEGNDTSAGCESEVGFP